MIKKPLVTRADLELELHRLWPARMASPAFAQRPSLTLDAPGVSRGYRSEVNLGRGASICGGGPSRQAARRALLESLQELAPRPPSRELARKFTRLPKLTDEDKAMGITEADDREARKIVKKIERRIATATEPARVRSPSCTNSRCRWLEGGYCGMCSPNCPHGNPYDSKYACAVCENST